MLITPIKPETGTSNNELDIFGGGDGSSSDNAVIISREYSRDLAGMEYEYINQIARQNNLRWKLDVQSLTLEGEKVLDVLSVIRSDGSKQDFYFDLTDTWE